MIGRKELCIHVIFDTKRAKINTDFTVLVIICFTVIINVLKFGKSTQGSVLY